MLAGPREPNQGVPMLSSVNATICNSQNAHLLYYSYEEGVKKRNYVVLFLST